MGNRSGKRLPNWIKNANRKANKKAAERLKRKQRPAAPFIPPGYYDIHQSIADYSRHYLNSYHSQKSYKNLLLGATVRSIYIRDPMPDSNQVLTLDLNSITFCKDSCDVSIRWHQPRSIEARSRPPWYPEYDKNYDYLPSTIFKGVISDPNFFDLLRVFLDESILKYWGCETFSGYWAKKGGIAKICAVDLESALDSENIQIIEIKRSSELFDEPPEFDVQIDGLSVGTLFAFDGYLQFQNNRTIIRQIASDVDRIRSMTNRIVEEINHDYSSSSNT